MLLEWIVSASALAAAVLVLRALFHRRISQRLQYWLWLPVLLRLLIPVPLFRSPVSVSGAAAELAPAAFAHPSPRVEAPAEAMIRPAETPEAAAPGSSAPKPMATPSIPETARVPAPASVPAPAKELTVGETLARLWLAGSAAMALWLLGVNLRFARRLRRSRRLLREGRTPVFVSAELASPCLFGLLRPAVYLTEACADGPEEMRGQVVLHEETHRRQGDHIWGCLRCLCLAVWWWNPLVWLAALCSRRDGELSCDEKVLVKLGEDERLDYGRTLVALLPGSAPRPYLTAATLSGGARAMKERLGRIVKRPRTWVLAAVIVSLLALLAVGCAFAGKPAEAPAPTLGPGEEWLLPDREPEIDSISYTLFTWETYTLRRGMAGFDEALDMLLALRGSPCDYPPAGPSVLRTLDFGKRVNLEYDGSTLRGFFSDHWLDLSAMGRPDEDLAALFERYGERLESEAVPADYRGRTEDGSMTVTPERAAYDWRTVRETVRQDRELYLTSGDRRREPGEGDVKLILENHTDFEISRDDVVRLEALRNGEWVGLSPYSGYASLLTPYFVPAEGTDTVWLRLSMFNDPLEPGRYRASVLYSVPNEDGTNDLYYEHAAFGEFSISEDAEPMPEDDGTELLLNRKSRENVESVTYTLQRYETVTLRRGDAGFEEALDILFSLRGTPCEEPQPPYCRRSFDLDPRVDLVCDGEHVYGSSYNGHRWLLLTGEARPDRTLAQIFRRFGDLPDPLGAPADYSGMTEDGSVALWTGQPAYDADALNLALSEQREAYEENGTRVTDGRTVIPLTIETRTEEPCHYGASSFSLEMLADGQWITRQTWSDGYYLVELSLLGQRTIDVQMEGFIAPLEPGHYRFAFTYGLGERHRFDHVAFAEFDLTRGGEAPIPTPTPEPTP